MAGDGGWRKAKRKDPEPGSVEPSPSGASRVRPTKPRTGNAKAPALDPDDYRDEVLSEIDPRSLAQARDALIVQTDRLHRLRSEKDEAVAETTRIDAELQQTRAQWKKAVDAHDEATAATRDVQRELDDAKEALRRALTRRDADAAEMEEARSAVRVARDKQEQAQRDAAAARDDAKDARDAAARNERALTQRDESLARTSKDFEAAATSEIEALKERIKSMTEDARMTQERVAHLASELETSRTECTSLRGERDATRFTLESVKSAAKDEVDALRDSLRVERGRVEEAETRLASVDALKARNSKLEERERALADQLRDALGDVMRFKERARDAASFAASMNAQTSTMDAEWRAMREAVATRCARIEDEAALDRAKNNASNAARGHQTNDSMEILATYEYEVDGGSAHVDRHVAQLCGSDEVEPSPPVRRAATRGGGARGGGGRGAKSTRASRAAA